MTDPAIRKMPKTMRLDQSDDYVFEHAADAGEWAISGAFEFADAEPEDLTSKQRLAFAQGFLGLNSFGRSTVVSVTSATEADIETAIAALTELLIDRYGAPNREAARAAAEEEVGFALDLCDPYPVNQLLLVAREMTDDGIHESYSAAEKPGRLDHAKIWTIVPDDEAVS